MDIQKRIIGKTRLGQDVTVFQLSNDHGISMEIMDYGCTVMSLNVPDAKGNLTDIVTGYDSWEAWRENPAYFGSLIGRNCNRIGGASFVLDGKKIEVTANHGIHQLHGGKEGFSHKLWKAAPFSSPGSVGIKFQYYSKDGEEGFPGNLNVVANYCLTNQDEFIMEIEAEADKPTPVNLTNHAYFNLAGHDAGEIYEQTLQINADQITETDESSIPTGRLLPVKDTPFDFRTPHAIGERIHQLKMGYDDNFALNASEGKLALAAIARDPKSGRILEIYTTEPGIQLYTSNWFDGTQAAKAGAKYRKHGAFALETQHFPDSVNHPEFPTVILRPGETYRTTTLWKFLTV